MTEHKLQPVRGTKDIFGKDVLLFNKIVDIAKNTALNYGFNELQTPIFEFSEIFERNLGESSDIVEKEVYKFLDRSQNYLTLRPEFTAAVVRAFLSNGELSQSLPQKFFSYGPIFRYDRPQKGRQRQFHQINFEIFGEDNEYCDAETIAMANSILSRLNIVSQTELQINSLGCHKTKIRYEESLKKYFLQFKNKLSDDSLKRLEKNPLRILDSKDENDIEISKDAPIISNFFSDESKKRFDNVLKILDSLEISFQINNKLVRGLDYYTSTVFEFVINTQNAQNTVLAGGRYDNLVDKMSHKNCPAIGFAAGIERLAMLCNYSEDTLTKTSVIYVSDQQKNFSFKIAQDLRNNGLNVDFIVDANFKKQMKKAGQMQSRFLIIIGEDEINSHMITIKDSKDSSESKIHQDKIFEFISKRI